MVYYCYELNFLTFTHILCEALKLHIKSRSSTVVELLGFSFVVLEPEYFVKFVTGAYFILRIWSLFRFSPTLEF